MNDHTTPRHARQQASPIDQHPLSGKERYDLERSILVKVKRTPRFILRELFDFFQGRGDCFPSNARLAQVSGMSPRAVQLALRDLERREILLAVQDVKIASQRRLVLLDHPHHMKILERLGIWKGAMIAPPKRKPRATVAPPPAQTTRATVAPESYERNGRFEPGGFSSRKEDKTRPRPLSRAEQIAFLEAGAAAEKAARLA